MNWVTGSSWMHGEPSSGSPRGRLPPRSAAGWGQPRTHLCTVWEATRKDMRSPPVSSCPATREPPINRVPKTMPACGKGQTGGQEGSGWEQGTEPDPGVSPQFWSLLCLQMRHHQVPGTASAFASFGNQCECVCICAHTRACVLVELTHLALHRCLKDTKQVESRPSPAWLGPALRCSKLIPSGDHDCDRPRPP